ncbi:MAG: hypothetical protein ABI382_00610 [Nakamurella sp.]
MPTPDEISEGLIRQLSEVVSLAQLSSVAPDSQPTEEVRWQLSNTHAEESTHAHPR